MGAEPQRHLRRQACLSNSGGASQRQESHLVLPQHMSDGGFLALTSNERSEGSRQVPWEEQCACAAGMDGGRGSTARADGLKEKRLIIFAQASMLQPAGVACLYAASAPHPSLQIADRANTDPRALGEFVLCESGGEAMLFEQLSQMQASRRHPAWILPLSAIHKRVAAIDFPHHSTSALPSSANFHSFVPTKCQRKCRLRLARAPENRAHWVTETSQESVPARYSTCRIIRASATEVGLMRPHLWGRVA